MLQVADSLLAVSGIGVELHPSWLNIDFFPEIFIRNYLERVRSMPGTQLLKIDVLSSKNKYSKTWSRATALF